MKTKYIAFFLMLFVAAPAVFAQVSFQKLITITSGSTTIARPLGVNGDGPGGSLDNSVGLDSDPLFGSFQEQAAPPPPPSVATMDWTFRTVPGRVSTLPDGLGSTGAYMDFRNYFSSTQVDSFMVRIVGDNFDVTGATISWPNDLASYGTTWTIKPRSGSLFPTTDMIANTSVTIPAPNSGSAVDVIIIKVGAFQPSPVNFSASPNPLAFGNVATGITATQTLTITNTGLSTPLNITAISNTFTGTDFSYVTAPTLPITIAAGSSTTIQVQFAPIAGGAQTATLQFTHNAPGSPTTVNVTGTGNSQGGELCFRSPGQNVGDAQTGLKDTVQLQSYAGEPLRALQFRIINGSTSRLNSVSRGDRVSDPAKWIFQYEIGHGPVDPLTFASIDTIRLVILGVSDSIKASDTYPADIAYFQYSTTNTPLDASTTMELAEIIGSTSLGHPAMVTTCIANPQQIAITDLGVGQKGDANADGFVDILDLLQVIDHILDRITLQGSEFIRSDVAPWPLGDGNLDATDVALLQQMILNGEFPDGTPLPFTGSGNSVSKSATRATLYINVDGSRIDASIDANVAVKGVQFDLMGAGIETASTTNGTVLIGRNGRVLFYNANGVENGQLFSLAASAINLEKLSASNVTVADAQNRAMDVNVILVKKGNAVAGVFDLAQNFPNPFNPSTEISFTVPESMPVRLSIYNSIGEEVRTLLSGGVAAGQHTITWDGLNATGAAVASGVYFYRLSAGSFSAVRSMTLSK
ncbi:MAG: choice-of-anchor D domain-containing protein [Bacteroidetes bacterium]|nr:choice-of-anchor D domain-containing protein [Bacteroidota bacterium]